LTNSVASCAGNGRSGGEAEAARLDHCTELGNAHLRLIADLNKGIDHGLRIEGVKDRIDPSWVGPVGQGRGPGCVLTPNSPKRAGSVRHGRHGTQENAEKAPHKVPVLNIRGACDEDTGPHAGLDTMKAPAKSCSTKARELIVSPGRRLERAGPGFTLRTYTHFMPDAGTRGRAVMDARFRGETNSLETP
jgi:hypothetical protein